MIIQVLIINKIDLDLSNRASNITVEVPEVESEDGSIITPLTVSWSEGSSKAPHCSHIVNTV